MTTQRDDDPMLPVQSDVAPAGDKFQAGALAPVMSGVSAVILERGVVARRRRALRRKENSQGYGRDDDPMLPVQIGSAPHASRRDAGGVRLSPASAPRR